MANPTINTASFSRSADSQLSSRFFTLPAEIRNLIYLEFWKLNSTRQHIVKYEVPNEEHPQGVTERWSHVPCITDPCAPDARWPEYAESKPTSDERQVWAKRLKSSWCLHWACEEHAGDVVGPPVRNGSKLPKESNTTAEELSEEAEPAQVDTGEDKTEDPAPTKTGLMSLLTTCKRIYLEALPSLYANTTFVLTNTPTAVDFLTSYGDDPERYPIRSVEVCIRVTNLITEIYYPPSGGGRDEGPPAIFAGRARPTLSMTNNPWRHLCDGLAALAQLQELRVWLDSSDLRPWHKRVSETRFFARLFDVRGPGPERFVLALPELPERRGPDVHDLRDQYLEGANLDGAPFTVERSPRPNNWGVHLRNIVSIGPHPGAAQAALAGNGGGQ
ncbi:uncharacterized protein B0H64DRAFT_185516 [Chaetomium fimeti]|uniref:DUF7730 domain-containing protein n=1 Tax=Chaetomium fimeti TaxID=1854472 RepID=A0AAE0HD28_9PEZI|nr:hypothetical protein B0H64DRAFT_185516 [Chaetomium fimeti]